MSENLDRSRLSKETMTNSAPQDRIWWHFYILIDVGTFLFDRGNLRLFCIECW